MKQKSATLPNVVLFRSIVNDLPLFGAFLLAGNFAAWIIFLMGDFVRSFFGYEPLLMLALVLSVGLVLMSVVIVFRRYNVRYLITDDGIKALRGFLSNHQVDAKLEYHQIRGTEIHRNLFERLVGTGDLHVRGSTSDDTEVAFLGIRDPYHYQQIIEARHRLEVQGPKATRAYQSDHLVQGDSQAGFLQ